MLVAHIAKPARALPGSWVKVGVVAQAGRTPAALLYMNKTANTIQFKLLVLRDWLQLPSPSPLLDAVQRQDKTGAAAIWGAVDVESAPAETADELSAWLHAKGWGEYSTLLDDAVSTHANLTLVSSVSKLRPLFRKNWTQSELNCVWKRPANFFLRGLYSLLLY